MGVGEEEPIKKKKNYGKLVKQNLKDQFLQDWSSKLDQSSKGVNYRIFKDYISLEKYFLKLPKNLYINLAK